MTLDPYKPIPWEDFTLIPAPKRRAHRSLYIALTLAALAIATGTLIALAQ